jgi:hypothetical protein
LVETVNLMGCLEAWEGWPEGHLQHVRYLSVLNPVTDNTVRFLCMGAVDHMADAGHEAHYIKIWHDSHEMA